MADPVKIIAEAAQGFEGDESLARLLVRAAASGKADAVKFQLIYADELAPEQYPYYDLFHHLEMTDSAWACVAAEARRLRLELIFDVFGARSLSLARQLGVVSVKVHTTDFFNHDLVKGALSGFRTVYFSAGGIAVEELETFLESHGDDGKKLVMIYGFQAEPTPLTENNLRRLAALRQRFPGLRFGFMDHTAGDVDEAGWLAAVCLPYGVEVIEKHITLDPLLELEDHASALGVKDFKRFVSRIRAAEAALGRGTLEQSEAELAYRRRVVKKVTAARDLLEGEVIHRGDVVLLRSAVLAEGTDRTRVFERLESIIGKKINHAIRSGAAIRQEDLK